MQRNEDGGVVICCDFCGTDWDQVRPMVEGHRGSVLCLECLKTAVANTAPAAEGFTCTLCRQEKPPQTPCWAPVHPPAQANPTARVCRDCIEQAAGAFTKDRGTDWRREES